MKHHKFTIYLSAILAVIVAAAVGVGLLTFILWAGYAAGFPM